MKLDFKQEKEIIKFNLKRRVKTTFNIIIEPDFNVQDYPKMTFIFETKLNNWMFYILFIFGFIFSSSILASLNIPKEISNWLIPIVSLIGISLVTLAVSRIDIL